jgi:type IV pilus assembly protein PilQ
MRTEGSNVVIDVGNAKLPASLQKPIDVVDFATPVQRIEARSAGGGAKIVLRTEGNYEPLAYQTGNEYIVEIVPRAAAAKSAVGATGAVGATTSTGTARAYSGRPVTFNFQDVPVRTVLQLIAEESNLNIVASDTVTGNVTLRLINVPWDQALDIVLRAKGLDKRRDGNVVWVAPQKEIADYEQAKEDARIAIDNRAEMVTEYVPINYGNAEDIAKLLTEESKSGSGSGGAGAGNQQRGFLSGRGSISFDRRTNTLLIIDIPSKVTEIKRLIGLLDKPVDQVLIEARIVIATETFARELGAKFGINGATGDRNDPSSVGFGGSTSSAGANARARAANPTGPDFPINNSAMNVNLPVVNAAGTLALSILNFGNYMLDTELSALQEEGRGEVISNPRIVTSNQKEAVIRQGQEVGYVTISQQQGAGAAAIPNVQFKDVLLELKVTPTITNDGRVFLNMAVKKDEIDSFVQSGIGDVPQINKREVNTAVLINDGQTVVIGGVYEFRDRSDVSKVPWLGDLPVIGNLFKKRGRSKEKAELLIFVTPKVMQVAKRS